MVSKSGEVLLVILGGAVVLFLVCGAILVQQGKDNKKGVEVSYEEQ
jgi:preprotein translocase subunit SecG